MIKPDNCIYYGNLYGTGCCGPYVLESKFGLGQEFEEGFNAMGALTLGMAGIMVTVDLIGAALTPTVGALFSAIGADPCMGIPGPFH